MSYKAIQVEGKDGQTHQVQISAVVAVNPAPNHGSDWIKSRISCGGVIGHIDTIHSQDEIMKAIKAAVETNSWFVLVDATTCNII